MIVKKLSEMTKNVKHRWKSSLITDDEAYAIWKECGGYACDYYEYALKIIEKQQEKDNEA